MSDTKVEDFFNDADEFDQLLNDASTAAKNKWEADFVDGIADRFSEYGVRTFLSSRQLDSLNEIASQ